MIAYQHLHMPCAPRFAVIPAWNQARELAVGAACVQQVEQARHGGDEDACA